MFFLKMSSKSTNVFRCLETFWMFNSLPWEQVEDGKTLGNKL